MTPVPASSSSLRAAASAATGARAAGSSVALCSLLLPLLLLAACLPESRPEKVAIIGIEADFQSVNELVSPGSELNDAVVDRLFLQLVDEQPSYSAGPASFSPRLAESWEFSSDRLTLTFHLRPDLVWSDGTPLTAEDVRFSWQAQTHAAVAWNYASIKAAIADAEVVDPRTVRFHFTAPSATQLMDANEGVILPQHSWSQLPFERWRDQPEWFVEHLVTSGPFLLESWQRQQQIELVRNPRYYEPGLPRLDRVVLRILPDRATLIEQLIAGELDLIRMPDPNDLERIRAQPHLEVLEYEGRQYTFLSWNLKRPQFSDSEVRRALGMAIDRQGLIDTLWLGHARIATSPIVSTAWPHLNVDPLPYDPAAARAALTARGWLDGDGDGVREREGVALRFELTTNPGFSLRWDALQMIQAQLREVGVDAQPRLVEYNRLNAMNLEHDYDATLVALLMDTTLDLSYAFHSSAIDGGYNFGCYANPEVDRLIEEANAELDRRAAEPALLRIQEILHQEQPVLFLWEPRGMVAISRRLLGVRPDSLSDFSNLHEWDLDPRSGRG